jgi:hypothetical protein
VIWSERGVPMRDGCARHVAAAEPAPAVKVKLVLLLCGFRLKHGMCLRYIDTPVTIFSFVTHELYETIEVVVMYQPIRGGRH